MTKVDRLVGAGDQEQRSSSDDKLSLGECNPLIYSPDLSRQPHIKEALRKVSSHLIEAHQGKLPEELSIYSIPIMGGTLDRIVARFQTTSLTEEQIAQLERLVADMYRQEVRTRRRPGGSKVDLINYPEIEMPDKKTQAAKYDTTKLGWYFGPTMYGRVDYSDVGILVHRDVATTKMAQYLRSGSTGWFTEQVLRTPESRRKIAPKYTIELREGALSQAEIAAFITEIGVILETGQRVDDPRLIYDAYKGLYSLSVQPVGIENIRGLDSQIEEIKRRLFVPLENRDASDDASLHPRSILMSGVPGTGKTLAAELFLGMDNGVFFLPITVGDLEFELTAPLEKRWIIDRIERIAAETGMPVVIHVDDMEKLAEDQRTRVALMNLMNGQGRRNVLFLGSTNKPDAFPTQLLQPDRFVPVYFGLPSEEARYAILAAHARIDSRSGVQVFTSDEEREFILKGLSEGTQGFTPRLLEDICNSAKGFWFVRLQRELGRKIVPADFNMYPMTEQDWADGYTDVRSRYNLSIIEKEDKGIRDSVAQARASIGFQSADIVAKLFRRTPEEEGDIHTVAQ